MLPAEQQTVISAYHIAMQGFFHSGRVSLRSSHVLLPDAFVQITKASAIHAGFSPIDCLHIFAVTRDVRTW